MFSDSISEIVFRSLTDATRISSFNGSCNSKHCALTSKFNVSFFLDVIWYLLLKNGDIEINTGPVLPFAIMMKDLEVIDCRKNFFTKTPEV